MVLHYPNSTEHIKEYDIVRITVGVNKGLLAIINYVDRKKKELHCSVINNGFNIVLKITSVVFCYHNTRAAAKQWYKQMEEQQKKFINKYKSIDYIKNNWFTDYYIVNDFTAETIYNNLFTDNKVSRNYKLNWLINNNDIIELILTYNDFDFCDKVLSKNKNDYNKELFHKMFELLKK